VIGLGKEMIIISLHARPLFPIVKKLVTLFLVIILQQHLEFLMWKIKEVFSAALPFRERARERGSPLWCYTLSLQLDFPSGGRAAHAHTNTRMNL